MSRRYMGTWVPRAPQLGPAGVMLRFYPESREQGNKHLRESAFLVHELPMLA